MGGSASNGFLPAETAPFEVGGDPSNPGFKVQDLDLYKGLNLSRLDRRRQIVNAFDDYSRAKDAAASSTTDVNLERAYQLLTSAEAKRAFDLSEEPDSVREKYGGLHYNAVGQGCLLARRLVERGVPFVTVSSSGWDAHSDIIRLKTLGGGNGPLPLLDRALSTLIGDLSDRGLLDTTLVVVMGEFGRTPRLNSSGGRDHWPNCFSVALAGGGIRGGQVVGSSDALGEYPRDNPTTPSDLSATIFSLLGVDPTAELKTNDGRPVRVTPEDSRVISELLA